MLSIGRGVKAAAMVLEVSLCPGPSASDCRRLSSHDREHAATSPLF